MTRILEIVAESTRINKAGEFLVRLDTSDLEQQRATRRSRSRAASRPSTWRSASWTSRRRLNASEINKAELAKKFTAIELEKPSRATGRSS